MNPKKSYVENVLKEMKNKRVAVIGDMMIDAYLIGSVQRISPEAPVPVLDVKSEEMRFGGSANVCMNLISLGCQVIPIGIIGNDFYGHHFLELMDQFHWDKRGIFTADDRPTTIKTRVIAGNQQIVRVDREKRQDISADLTTQIMNFLKAEINTVDAIILEDYNKGLLNESLIQQIIELGNTYNKSVFVDPKFKNFFSYRNVTVFKPNLKELSNALAVETETMDDYKSAVLTLKEKIQAKNVLLTLSEKGMLLCTEDNQFYHVPTKAVEVADVSGAGDTVIATLVAAYICDRDLLNAVKLANEAAGIVVTELGIVPIKPEQLLEKAES